MHRGQAQVAIDDDDLTARLGDGDGQVGRHGRFTLAALGAGQQGHLRAAAAGGQNVGAQAPERLQLRVVARPQASDGQVVLGGWNLADSLHLGGVFDLLGGVERRVQVFGQQGQGDAADQAHGQTEGQVDRVARLGRAVGSVRFLDDRDGIGPHGLFQPGRLILS